MSAGRLVVVRSAVVVLLAVLAVLGRIRRRQRPGLPTAAVPAVVGARTRMEAQGADGGAAPGRGMQAARGVLLAFGVALLGFGAWVLVTTVSVKSLTGLAVWLAAAVVLHDAVLSPVVLVVARVLRRAGRRLPGSALAVVQIGIVVGAFLTLIAAPEIRAKALGPRNPSVLPFDYGLRLALIWAAIAVVTVVVATLLTRARARPGSLLQERPAQRRTDRPRTS